MAKPPKPFDSLTLLFACAEHGGVEACAFKLPAGTTAFGFKLTPAKVSFWCYPECLLVRDQLGRRMTGVDAVMTIAECRLSIQYTAQIIGVRPKSAGQCECPDCDHQRYIQSLAGLLGPTPTSED